MLLSKVQKVDHPYEVGQWFEFRGLSWVQLADARSQASAEQREIIKDLGPEFLSQLGSTDTEESDRAVKALEAQKYNASNYDTGTLLRAGVVDWSYENGDGESVAVTDETLANLDEATAVWACEMILDITKPPEGRTSDSAV